MNRTHTRKPHTRLIRTDDATYDRLIGALGRLMDRETKRMSLAAFASRLINDRLDQIDRSER